MDMRDILLGIQGMLSGGEYCVLNSSVGGVGVRRDTLDGVSCLVVPCIMIREGIWEGDGSGGGIFYDRSELARSLSTWNNKPVTLGHPVDGLDYWTKERIEGWRLGIMLNSSVVDEVKLFSELWLDIEKCERLSSGLVERLESEEVIDVSTGLYLRLNKRNKPEGSIGSAYDLRGDHLAILLDEVGACSVEDGAGTCRLHSAGGHLVKGNTKQEELEMAKEKTDVEEVVENSEQVIEEPVVESTEEEVVENSATEVIEEVVIENASEPVIDEPVVENTSSVSIAGSDYDVSMVEAALSYYNHRRGELSGKLVSNSKCLFSKEELEKKDVSELEKLDKMLSESVSEVNYGAVSNVSSTSCKVAPLPEVD